MTADESMDKFMAFMDKALEHPVRYIFCLLLGVAVFVFANAWIGAHFEAKAFENVTGKHVSTWDALWIELRVDDD